MDNRVTIPGYKYYVDDRTGERPPVLVTFLNVEETAGGEVNGVLLPVTTEDLADMDRRERNYCRVDVTDQVRPAAPGRVSVYVGSPQARGRYDRAAAQGLCVVQRGYYDAVLQGFARRGEAALEHFHQTTDPPGCPLRDLRRVDMPPPQGSRGRATS